VSLKSRHYQLGANNLIVLAKRRPTGLNYSPVGSSAMWPPHRDHAQPKVQIDQPARRYRADFAHRNGFLWALFLLLCYGEGSK